MLIFKKLTTEYMENPIGLPLDRVRFGWIVAADGRNEKQTAYHIRVKTDRETVWDSGKVCSSENSGVVYQGQPLQPRTKYFWQVQVETERGQTSVFSAWQTFETTLSPAEWESAPFIGAKTSGLPLLRKSFILPDKKIIEGRVYICGLGSYTLSLNGARVSEELLTPMVTRYHKRYLYNTYDVTPLLQTGENAFGVMLGNGYYCMHSNGIEWQKENWANAPWADQPKCRLLAFVRYEDGTEQMVATDESWKSAESPLRVDEPYYGEDYDARLERTGWDNACFDDSGWGAVEILQPPLGKAEPQRAESCAVMARTPLTMKQTGKNEYFIDVNKITVGWIRLTVQGERGDEVSVSYSEWTDERGELDQKFLLSVWNFAGKNREPQTDYFTLKDGGISSFAPLFQYKGFRYARIRTKGKVKIQDATLETVYADLQEIGVFSCSDERLNELHNACKNTLLHNLHSYPSDTPVYENLGYLADGYLTQEMAHYNFNAVNFYAKWARDIFDQVKADGYIEQTAPMWDEDKENAPEWSVGIAVVPYQIYRLTGDFSLLVEGYEKIKKAFAYQMSLTKGGVATSMWGDHASVSGKTLKGISATAALYFMAKILAETARLQGLKKEEITYLSHAEEIKKTFRSAFYNDEKGYYCESDSDEFVLGAQVIPYALGLIDEPEKEGVKNAIKRFGTDFDGGIFGVKYLFPVLTELGLEGRLYAWLTSTSEPSFGHWLSSGDGTLWEQWYGFTRSRNHHMFATVDEWLYKSVGGVEILDGKRLKIKPYFAKELTWANACTETVNGEVYCRWQRTDKGVSLAVEIPFNMTAVVYLPCENGSIVYESGRLLSTCDGIKQIESDFAGLVIEIGSGVYNFEIK